MKYFWAINIEKSTTMKWMVKGQEDNYCLTIDKNKKRVKYRRQRRRYMSHRTRLYYFHQFWYMLWEMALYDFKPLNVPNGFYQKKKCTEWVSHSSPGHGLIKTWSDRPQETRNGGTCVCFRYKLFQTFSIF